VWYGSVQNGEKIRLEIGVKSFELGTKKEERRNRTKQRDFFGA